MVWTLGGTSAAARRPGRAGALRRPQIGSQNLARFKHAEFDAIYERDAVLPDGPERAGAVRRGQAHRGGLHAVQVHVHRIFTDLTHPWLIGYRRPLFCDEWWHIVDVDTAGAPALNGQR